MIADPKTLAPILPAVGVDLADAVVDLARTRHPSRRIEQGDLATLPVPRRPVCGGGDAVLVFDHSHPQRGDSEILAEFRRVRFHGSRELDESAARPGEKNPQGFLLSIRN